MTRSPHVSGSQVRAEPRDGNEQGRTEESLAERGTR